jgi:hypothetical protein
MSEPVVVVPNRVVERVYKVLLDQWRLGLCVDRGEHIMLLQQLDHAATETLHTPTSDRDGASEPRIRVAGAAPSQPSDTHPKAPGGPVSVAFCGGDDE